MPLRFSLEAILRLRRSQQRQQEILMQRANQQVNELLSEIEALHQQIQNIGSLSQRMPSQRGAEIGFDTSRSQILAQLQRDAMLRLVEAREQQARVAKELQHAWQQREIVEVLKRHQMETFAADQMRHEQQAQDEIFSRRRRKRTFLPGD